MTIDAGEPEAQVQALFDDPEVPGDAFVAGVRRRLARARRLRRVALAGAGGLAVATSGWLFAVAPSLPAPVDLPLPGVLVHLVALGGASAWAWVWAES